jgi:hypothetical protein
MLNSRSPSFLGEAVSMYTSCDSHYRAERLPEPRTSLYTGAFGTTDCSLS